MSRVPLGRATMSRANVLSRVLLSRTLLSFVSPLALISHAQGADGVSEAPLEEIFVTASPYRTTADELATLVGEVNRADILRDAGASLADTLSTVPGITGSGFAAGASRPVIRGFDANRVRILENGIGSFDASDVGPDHGVPIDPLATQKVEIVRGAATLRYGSQAIGGVVNALNNRVPLGIAEGTSGEIVGNLGTGANLRQGAALIDQRSGAFSVHVDGFARRAGDIDTPGGSLSNSYFKGSGAALGGGYNGDNVKAGAAAVRTDAAYGIPNDENYIDLKQTKGLFRAEMAFDGVVESINVDAGYGDYKHSEKDSADVPQATFIDKEWDSRIETLFAATNTFSALAAGVQLQYRDFSALGEGEDYLLPTETTNAAAFAFAESPMSSWLTLQGAARVEYVRIAGTPLSNRPTTLHFTPVSGSVGAVFKADDQVTMGLTFSSAARAPAQTELFARGPHEGPRTFEIGNEALGTERANSVEATARFERDGLAIEAAAWAARFENYIFGQLTGRTCDDGGVCAAGDLGELKEVAFTARDAWFRGLEAKASVPVIQRDRGALTWDVMADYVRAKLTGNAGNVPRIPAYRVGTGLAWLSPLFDVAVRYTYTGEQNKTSLGETRTSDFSSVDAHIAWRPLPRTPGFELQLVGRNLTDTEQRNAVAFNKDEVLLPGRDVRLLARFVF